MGDGAILSGQLFEPGDNLIIPFTKQVKDYTGPDTLRVTGNEGDAGTEISVRDRAAAEVTIYDLTAIHAALDSLYYSYADTADIALPDILTGIEVSYNKTSASGVDSHPASQMDFFSINTAGGTANGTYNPSASSEGSAAILPSLVFNVKETWSQNVPVTVYLFYMVRGASDAAILTRLTALAGASVLAWPTFRPVAHTFSLKGMQVSVRASADSRASLSLSPTSYDRLRQWGSSYSGQVGVSNDTVRIPSTLHGALTITTATDSLNATAAADASTPAISGTMNGVGFSVAAISNVAAVATATASASVTPTSLAATSPAALPVSGLYRYRNNGQPFKFGYDVYRAIVFNFASVA